MKKIVEEVEGEGLVALLGKRVVIWCECYIYTGILKGVNEQDILLTAASVVYETGPLDESGFQDSQAIGTDWYIRTAKIESYGAVL